MLALVPAFNISVVGFRIFYKSTYAVGDYFLFSVIRVVVSQHVKLPNYFVLRTTVPGKVALLATAVTSQ
jgi:hypothetical protein